MSINMYKQNISQFDYILTKKYPRIFMVQAKTIYSKTIARTKKLLTLYNAILRIVRNFLETRENIKISTHPFYHINLG